MFRDRLGCESVIASNRESPLHAPRGQVRSPEPKQICVPNNAKGCSRTGHDANLFSLTTRNRPYTYPEGRPAPPNQNRFASRTTPKDAHGQVATHICFSFRPRVAPTRTQRAGLLHRTKTDLHQEHRHEILSGRLRRKSVFAYDRESPLHAPRGQIRSIAHKQICTKNTTTEYSVAGRYADLFSLTTQSRGTGFENGLDSEVEMMISTRRQQGDGGAIHPD